MAGVSLSRYLSEAATRPWAWGEFDCLLFLADWVERSTGIDPAGEYRGVYHDECSARRLIKSVGGIAALVERCAARVGFIETQAPRRGDIGLVRVGLKRFRERIIMVPMGAICLRPALWAIKPADGHQIMAQSFPLIRAWSRA